MKNLIFFPFLISFLIGECQFAQSQDKQNQNSEGQNKNNQNSQNQNGHNQNSQNQNRHDQILRLKRLTDLVNPDSISIGKKAPNFAAVDRNGASLLLSSLRGKYVIINFWAESVAASLNEIPYWERAKKKFSRNNIEFERVSLEPDINAWIRYYDQHNLKGVQLHGDPYKAPLSYYLLKPHDRKGKQVLSYTLPHYYLIDKNGIILDNDILVRPSDTLAFDLFLSKLPGI